MDAPKHRVGDRILREEPSMDVDEHEFSRGPLEFVDPREVGLGFTTLGHVDETSCCMLPAVFRVPFGPGDPPAAVLVEKRILRETADGITVLDAHDPDPGRPVASPISPGHPDAFAHLTEPASVVSREKVIGGLGLGRDEDAGR